MPPFAPAFDAEAVLAQAALMATPAFQQEAWLAILLAAAAAAWLAVGL